MTIKTLEQFDQEYAAKRKELEFEIQLADRFSFGTTRPAYCSNIKTDGDKCKAWVSFKEENLVSAYDLALLLQDKFTLRTVQARRSSCLSIQPAGWHEDSYQNVAPEWELEHCVEVRQYGGRGFYSFEVSFWLDEPAVKVQIEVKDVPYKLRASKPASYDRHGNVVSAEFNPPPYTGTREVLFAGGSRDSYDHREYFNGVNAAFETLGKYLNGLWE
jgi:hypothetical protein